MQQTLPDTAQSPDRATVHDCRLARALSPDMSEINKPTEKGDDAERASKRSRSDADTNANTANPTKVDESFPSLKAKMKDSMSKDGIIDMVEEIWESEHTSKQTRELMFDTIKGKHEKRMAKLRDSWMPADDQTIMLNYDWKSEDSRFVFKVKSVIASKSKTIMLQGEGMETEVAVEDLKEMLDEGGVEELEDEEFGCEECGVGGSTLSIFVEYKESEDKYRLFTESGIMCACMSGYPERNGGGKEYYYAMKS